MEKNKNKNKKKQEERAGNQINTYPLHHIPFSHSFCLKALSPFL
jgi:hypothetical protein